MRYYIIAGERSGDLHGGNLVKALKRHDVDAKLRGFGGEYMQEEGVELQVHYRDMAFMGLAEILSNLKRFRIILSNAKQTSINSNRMLLSLLIMEDLTDALPSLERRMALKFSITYLQKFGHGIKDERWS